MGTTARHPKARSISWPWVRRLIPLAIAVVLVSAAPASAAEDLESFAQKLADVFVALSGMGLVYCLWRAGMGVMGGSEDSGKWLGRAAIAGFLFILGMAGPEAAKAAVERITGIRAG